jgi:uncharacterized membrane protein YbhN (UPF0104 family)
MEKSPSPVDRSKAVRWLSLGLRIAVAVGVLAWVLGRQDWGKLLNVLLEIGLWPFLWAMLAFVVSQVLLAIRWWVLLWAQDIPISIPAAVRLHFMGLFYNNIMPSSVGGDVLRAWYVAKHTEKRWEAALSVFFDRFWGLFGLVLIAGFSYVVFWDTRISVATESAPTSGNWDSLGTGVLGVFIAILVCLVAALLVPVFRGRLLDRVLRIGNATGGVLIKVKAALWIYTRRPTALLTALGLTFLLQSLVITVFWILGRSMGIQAGLDIYFIVFPVTWVMGALPISVAGWGILEMGIVELFGRLADTAPEQALALALCQRFIWMLCSLPGAVIHLRGGHLPRSFSIDPAGMD